MTAVMLVLTVLATARLTRLVTSDKLTGRPREAVLRWLVGRDPESLLAYLLVCDWCASMYTGAVVAGAWWAWGETIWFTAVTLALTASYVTGFLASKTEG